MNDIVQWGCVAVILGIALYSVAKRIVSRIRSRRDGTPPGCGCGCDGCALSPDCPSPSKKLPSSKNFPTKK